MGTKYNHLTLNERIELYRLHAGGIGIRQIAARLGRSPSTLSREVARNSVPTKAWTGGYDPARAHSLAERRRRWDGRYKLARQPALREAVRNGLAMGWSPEQIAGRLTLQHGYTLISYESIYRFIYHRSAQKDYWHRLLPRHKSRRGSLGMRGGSSTHTIKSRISVHEREPDVLTRQTPGHWEADLMLFSQYGQAVLVTHERTSRMVLVTRQANKASQTIAQTLTDQMASLPEALRQTMTFDNGTEFALHLHADHLGMKTYFCDTHSPWQKGGVENAIGRMRRTL